MFLKSFFFNVYLLSHNISFFLSIFIFLFAVLLLVSDLRRKFILFVFFIILISIWGFLHDLDGIFLIFLTAEFTIFLLFLMTYLQLYVNYNFITSNSNHFIYLVLLLLFFNYSPVHTVYAFSSFYKHIYHIVSSDFYVLYYFLFEQIPLLTIIITLIISFFSLFFIVMYFSLKFVKLFNNKETKSVYMLRRQILTKQTSYLSKLYTFQN